MGTMRYVDEGKGEPVLCPHDNPSWSFLYRSGASIKEIAEVAGHSEREAEAIIRGHYLSGDVEVKYLENANKPRRKL